MLFCCLLSGLAGVVFAQEKPVAIGFEKNRLNGWILTSGDLGDQKKEKVYLNETEGILGEEFVITSRDQQTDPVIRSLSTVAPGSSHSIRIGNNKIRKRFSRISSEFTVTENRAVIFYRFAAVMENPTLKNGGNTHYVYSKPDIRISVLDETGSKLACGGYESVLTDTEEVAGFNGSGLKQYRDWTTGVIDLRKYLGKAVTIEVTVSGCIGGGHYGYAYFDAAFFDGGITPDSPCADENGYMTLHAPAGMARYKWNTGDTTSAIRVKAKLGDRYFVQVVPERALEGTCPLQLDYTIHKFLKKSTVDTTICDGQQLAVGDTVFKTTGTFTRFIPQRVTCDSVVTVNLRVVPMKLLVMQESKIAMGDSALITALVEPAGDYRFLWREERDLSCTDCAETWAHPLKSTFYTVTVTDADKICTREGKVAVTIKPCGISIPDAFSPDNDGINDVFFVYGNNCVTGISEMAVYSRSGEMIFNRKNISASDAGSGWDGKYKGHASEPGLYAYRIKVTLLSGEMREFTGGVRLIR